MMDYIPGQIHESFQKEHFFLITQDFIWINCGLKRFGEINQSKDWDETSDVSLKKGDVIVVRFFKSTPTSETYSYLERVIYLRVYPNRHEEVIDYKKESIISLSFIQSNLFLFSDVTKEFERERKLESILC
jgi:hypothetical protein